MADNERELLLGDPDLTLQRLVAFVRAAESPSFRKAADSLRITQPALTGQIQQLEKLLGVALFERTTQGAVLTSLGKQILPRAQALLRSAERFVEFTTNLRSGESGVISVACYPVHLERCFAAVLGAFRLDHPLIRIDLTRVKDDRRRGLGRSLFEELESREVDFAIGPPHLQLGLKGVLLYEARIVALLTDDEPLRHMPQISIADLRNRRLLIAPRHYFSREKVEASAKQAGFAIHVEHSSASPTALQALGIHGLGVAVLPDDYPTVGSVTPPYPVVVDMDGNELTTPVWLQWREAEPLSPQCELLLEYVIRWAEQDRVAPYRQTRAAQGAPR